MTDQAVDISTLRKFSPLDGLKRENIAALAKKTRLMKLEPGRRLFREGDSEKRTFYLVSGSLELSNKSGTNIMLGSDSAEARLPVTPALPRRFNAKALDEVQYLSIDSDLLDVMLTWDQTGDYEVSELQQETTDDWMSSLLQTKAFHRIPPANIQAIFMRMQQISYSPGDVIIRQGDEGDYFYAITNGRCSVTRETPLNKEGIKLAELGPGDTFGEEALISQSKRNATITMLTEGTLMRLGKDDFQKLLKEPMLNWIEYHDAKRLVTEGAQWLDVRLPSEFEAKHETEAINIPLYFIRLKISTLDPEKTYILCCDTGRRSSAGAFILNERGFTTKVLKGGLNMSSLDVA